MNNTVKNVLAVVGAIVLVPFAIRLIFGTASLIFNVVLWLSIFFGIVYLISRLFGNRQ